MITNLNSFFFKKFLPRDQLLNKILMFLTKLRGRISMKTPQNSQSLVRKGSKQFFGRWGNCSLFHCQSFGKISPFFPPSYLRRLFFNADSDPSTEARILTSVAMCGGAKIVVARTSCRTCW